MEAGLEAFIKEYTKQANLSEVSVALLAGAMSYKAIHKLEDYKKFVITLNNVAPQLISYIELAGKDKLNMLTANEARELMELDTITQRQLDLIDTMIRSAAQSGSHETVYYINNFDVRQRIFEALQDNGFKVESLSSTRLGISW